MSYSEKVLKFPSKKLSKLVLEFRVITSKTFLISKFYREMIIQVHFEGDQARKNSK